MLFRDVMHEKHYKALIEQAELTEKELENPTALLKKQLAFLYLIALYQEDYLKYEGCYFYVQDGEELSIGGPTYLLEDKIGEGDYPHEHILQTAKGILSGEMIDLERIPAPVCPFVGYALAKSK